jgi:hypothetical protein
MQTEMGEERSLNEKREMEQPQATGAQPGAQPSLGDEILALVEQKCKNPGEAFVLLQQLTIFVWDQYKIDWSAPRDNQAGSTRKSRYLDYLSQLLDTLKSNQSLAQKID